MRRLVKAALRMRPSSIIVGEVRQESLDLLIALNSGVPVFDTAGRGGQANGVGVPFHDR